ncbi:SoxR reducing system RseC family protein [Candidatus Dojkabacteria bacterium]|nr:SoxR reducing system RseC family protein [Candidatus Dojkabacteria bacterium]
MILKNIIKHSNTKMALKTTKKQSSLDVFTVSSASDQKKLGARKVEKIPEIKPGDQINVAVKKEDIRGRVASVFLVGFFIVLISVIVISVFSEGDKISNLKEAMLTVSGILAAPLGFVIGYYFRSQEEKD